MARQTDFEVVAEADNSRQAVELVRQLKPDMVLIDIAMPLPNGIHATEQIRRETRRTHILILTQHESEEYICRALAAGASGYLLKDTDSDELVSAIHPPHLITLIWMIPKRVNCDCCHLPTHFNANILALPDKFALQENKNGQTV